MTSTARNQVFAKGREALTKAKFFVRKLFDLGVELRQLLQLKSVTDGIGSKVLISTARQLCTFSAKFSHLNAI